MLNIHILIYLVFKIRHLVRKRQKIKGIAEPNHYRTLIQTVPTSVLHHKLSISFIHEDLMMNYTV